ncbi:alpha/beta fold hydrolase [Ruegeria lacuscaerulensis]|uniref:alpha/beta fold hydrolase n=1 Tax=Ruegeria lacuscaerulensis TaxID=55218 RepID=UPI0014818B37|nr:alpha/beta fold hydrolase [Ruegeria lacuscaerulensis]
MGQWVLNLNDGKLSSEQGNASLSPKATDILALLVAKPGVVLSREEILHAVWKDLHVSPDLVREYIFEIRKALGDKAKDSQYIETVGRRGFRLIGQISVQSGEDISSFHRRRNLQPDTLPTVKFCQSYDGTSIAHTASGEGYPLLISGSWMTHLEQDWQNPAYGDYIRHLSQNFSLIRYDQRGNGLSQWANVDISFDRMVDDMEVVVDAYGFEKVAILGLSQGASVSVAYALRHPSRISHLILSGGYPRGRRQRGNRMEFEESEALVQLIRTSWGNDNPAIRQILTTMFMPDATKEETQWFNEFQKLCGPAENIAQFRALFDDINVSGLLPQVTVPTLVIHSDRDAVAPLSEGKLLASKIPNALFVQLNSPNHLLFEAEPDFTRMIASIRDFVEVPNN